MTVASGVYNVYVRRIIKNSSPVDYDGDTIRAELVKYSHTPNFDTHDFLNDIPVADRAKSAAGGTQALTSTVDSSATANKIFYSSNVTTLSFPSVTSGIVVGGVVVYKSSGSTRTASPLVCFSSFTASKTADGGDVVVTLNANGIMQASYQV